MPCYFHIHAYARRYHRQQSRLLFCQMLLIEVEIASGGTAGAMQTRFFIRECNLTQKRLRAYFAINEKKSQYNT